MNIYRRIFNYSSANKAVTLIKFLFFAILGVVFGLINLTLAIPLLDVLFKQTEVQSLPPYPVSELSIDYVTKLFNYHFLKIVMEYGSLQALLFVCAFLVGTAIMANIFRYLERMVATNVKVDVVKNMRMHIFQSVTNLHIGYFNDQRKGDLISRFTNDINEVENSVLNLLKSVIKEPITIVCHLGALFFISTKLTLFALIALPVIGGMIAYIIRLLRRPARDSQESQGRVVNILDEVFGGMRVVKAFNARPFVLKKMDEETSIHRRANILYARRNELSSPLSEVLGIMVVAVIVYVGGNLVFGGDGELRAAQFLAFLAIFASVIQPAKNFSNGITSIQKGTISAERIFELIDMQPQIRNKPDAKPVTSFTNRIEFKNVSFAYNQDPVLKHINLVIEKGKTVALVGPSGGGKSTLADLVPRFYDPQQGEVLLDGVALVDYELESLRRLMGVVTQESILFNDTILNNIAFGMENVREEDVIQAAKVANAHDFIMQTEKGYQTSIGERGSKLSGGQRQRLSIARAVLKNPPILILDEATSALDSESERLVQDALNNLMKNRTSIVIAHRLSTIQHADQIVVIQNGQILEQGNHDELVRQGGLYRKLSEIQKA
jgi:ATP-binding cassette, subfamily B, bacterial MsbA